jgi:hypothetical protein
LTFSSLQQLDDLTFLVVHILGLASYTPTAEPG